MTSVENRIPAAKKLELEDIAPGIVGRAIPPEEVQVTEEQVRKLAEEAGADEFADFIYRLYNFKPPKVARGTRRG